MSDTPGPLPGPDPVESVAPAPGAAPGGDLLTFPCSFPVKVMGPSADGFVETMVSVVRRHAPTFDANTVEVRASGSRRYLSVTATIEATSRDQLDNLYRELTSHPMVSVVL